MGQSAEKLTQLSLQSSSDRYDNPRITENIRRHRFVDAFGREMGKMLVNTVADGFHVGVKQLQNLCDSYQLSPEEQARLQQQITDFAPKFTGWFRKKFSNALTATVGINSRYSEQVVNNDLARLLCATTAEIHLQNALQAAFDTAIRNYKQMMCETGVPVEPVYQDWGVDVLLLRTNPANISLMLTPLLDRLSVSDNARWIVDRTMHAQIFLKLSDFYREVCLALENVAKSHTI